MSNDPLAPPTALPRRLALVNRRCDLLAPAHAMAEHAARLVQQPAVRADAAASSAMELVHGAAAALVGLLEKALGPGGDGPAADFSALEHHLRTQLTIVIGYSERLIRRAASGPLAGLVEDFRCVRDLGWRSVNLADDLVRFLRSSDGADGPDEALDIGGLVGLVGSPASSAPPGAVLIAEDNHAVREALAGSVRDLGHEVELAADGAEALARATARPFDLLLLDLLLPRLNGLEVLRRLKADPRRRDLPVLVVSGLGDSSFVRQAIALGADDYLPKPPDHDLLRVRVNACLERYRLRRRCTELLHNVLPPRIVEEYLADGDVAARRRDRVAVLFADIQNFTTYCDSHPAEEVVGYLGELFPLWDDVAQSCGVQKIKTIGDCFMGAAGLLEPADNPVLNCVRCGLRLLESVRGHEAGWQLRIGVHVGPVVAGLLGKRQFLYDLWGDTVNVAARMESLGDPGCVTLSATAYRMVADRFPGLTPSARSSRAKACEPERLVYALRPEVIRQSLAASA
jgi:class 3 adenylate cyclase